MPMVQKVKSLVLYECVYIYVFISCLIVTLRIKYILQICLVKDLPMKRLNRTSKEIEKKKKTTDYVHEFKKVSKALCHTGKSFVSMIAYRMYKYKLHISK